ncbi:MAG: hypothetical protein R6V85_08670 [Polyangia bacterium]
MSARTTHTTIALVTAAVLIATGCGQRQADWPDSGASAGGICGPWYPGGDDAGAGGGYAVDQGATFPCAVWESARLAGEDTFFNVGQLYLETVHGQRDDKALLIAVSARNCQPCAALIEQLAARADQIEAAGAVVLGMSRTDLQAPDEPYLDLDEAYQALADEGWPVDRWIALNDAEGYLPARFDTGTPWIVVVRLDEMRVVSASNLEFPSNEDGVQQLIDFISGL